MTKKVYKQIFFSFSELRIQTENSKSGFRMGVKG